jgi:DNA-binding CsgD family transcriptional regulator
MTNLGLVVFGDVIDSRIDGPASARWLRELAAELDEVYGPQRCAPFGFTQGDELQGVLLPGADPLVAVLRATLRETSEDGPPTPRMRWAIAAGPIEPGEGPATQWTGPAFVAARELIEPARRRRDQLVVRSGGTRADGLLDDVAPVLGGLLADLTPRQRFVGKLLIVDGLRQSEAADRLGIARPTVSVAAERAHIRDIERLRRATLELLREGLEAAS